MKKIILLVVSLALCIVSFGQAQKNTVKEADTKGKGGKGGTPSKDIELNAVIEKINKSLSKAQSSLNDVSLKEGSVTLETTYTKGAEGGFKIFVKASRKWSKETTNSVTYKYSKPEKLLSVTEALDDLAAAIVDAARQYKNSTAIEGLEKDGFEIEISFAITKTTSGGVEFEIFGVGIDTSAEFEKNCVPQNSANFWARVVVLIYFPFVSFVWLCL